MRSRGRLGLLALVFLALTSLTPPPLLAAGSPSPLGPREREVILALVKAVDLAQEVDAASAEGLSWDHHVLKSGNETAYVPFRLTLDGAAAALASTAIYVRAVTRRDGFRVKEERSLVRNQMLHASGVMARMPETVFVGVGEMPVGGLATASSKQSTSAAATATAALALQTRAYEKQKKAEEAAKVKLEKPQRDPLIFPFEDYYFVERKSARGADGRSVERALALPPGEYDVFVALVDREKVKTSSPTILKRTIRVPDFWNDQFRLSSLILAKDVRPLNAPLAPAQQVEHPYTLGRTEIVPVAAPSFSTGDALLVVFQMCNYGAPDADLTADYVFYRTDGTRRLFNHTNPQQYADADLPPPGMWTTQAFAMQNVPLQPFPPGAYELEVTVHDRLTRATAKETVAFTVVSGVR